MRGKAPAGEPCPAPSSAPAPLFTAIAASTAARWVSGSSPSGSRCTTATLLSTGRSKSRAASLSAETAGDEAGVRPAMLPWPPPNPGRYTAASAAAATQAAMMNGLSGPATTRAKARAAKLRMAGSSSGPWSGLRVRRAIPVWFHAGSQRIAAAFRR